jgi:hypothetical protein
LYMYLCFDYQVKSRLTIMRFNTKYSKMKRKRNALVKLLYHQSVLDIKTTSFPVILPKLGFSCLL